MEGEGQSFIRRIQFKKYFSNPLKNTDDKLQGQTFSLLVMFTSKWNTERKYFHLPKPIWKENMQVNW